MDMNTVISWGLSAMGIIAVGGWIAISICTGTSSGTEVPIAIISGLTGVLTGKNIAENKMMKEKLEKQSQNDPLQKEVPTLPELSRDTPGEETKEGGSK